MKRRVYEMVRDGANMPTKLVWIGDYDVPTKREKDQSKLAEYEQVYGKRDK